MKAKLIKKKDGWYNLYQDNIGIGSTHSELQGYKLSLKNCQAIECGYDLDEWEVEIEMICPHPQDTYRCGLEYGCDEDGCNHPNQVPYLDADGCLILKRINL